MYNARMKMNSPKALILDGFYCEWDFEKKSVFFLVILILHITIIKSNVQFC